MENSYNKFRYNHNMGYRILHVKGDHAGESVNHNLHHSPNYMILYFIHGKGNIKIEGRSYPLGKGDIVILNPSELFRIWVDDSSYHERLTLSLSEAMLAGFPDSCNSLFTPFYNRKKGVGNLIRANLANDLKMDECFAKILEFSESTEPASSLFTFCEISHLLKLLNLVHNQKNESDSEQITMNPLISDVLSYLNLHYKDDLSIAVVAEEFHINESHLSHLFKEHMGMSLWSYVTFRRIQLFNDLIKNNNSVERTCYLVGFRNYSNFFRLYKKHMNMTPTEYKKQVQSGAKIIPPLF